MIISVAALLESIGGSSCGQRGWLVILALLALLALLPLDAAQSASKRVIEVETHRDCSENVVGLRIWIVEQKEAIGSYKSVQQQQGGI